MNFKLGTNISDIEEKEFELITRSIERVMLFTLFKEHVSKQKDPEKYLEKLFKLTNDVLLSAYETYKLENDKDGFSIDALIEKAGGPPQDRKIAFSNAASTMLVAYKGIILDDLKGTK